MTSFLGLYLYMHPFHFFKLGFYGNEKGKSFVAGMSKVYKPLSGLGFNLLD